MSQAPSSAQTSPKLRTGLKLSSIQYLRAFAAAGVVAYHAANTLLGHDGHLINLNFGTYGVDVFFVVSGFIMFYTTYGTDMGPGEFFAKRLIRIFPLYFILSTLLFAGVFLFPAAFNKESPDVVAYLESIFFIPHWNPRFHDLQPILGPGWTLNYEMFFYLIFAASLFIRHRLRGLAVLPVIGLLAVAGYLHPMRTPASMVYTSPMLLEFCFGIIVAAAFTLPEKAGRRWPFVVMLFCGVVGACMYLFRADSFGSEAVRPLFVGLPCTLLVALFVAVERSGRLPQLPFLALVGDASYSLYLVQVFTIGAGQRLWHHVGSIHSVLSHALFILFELVFAIGLALIVYRYVEQKVGRRLNAALRRLQARHRASGAGAQYPNSSSQSYVGGDQSS
jgi:exopolysaccharide production protein ExoZ